MSIHILTINSNGQITLPSKYRKTWGLKPNTKIKVKISDNKTFSLLESDVSNYTLDDLPNIIGKVSPISDEIIKQVTSQAFDCAQNISHKK